MSGWLAISVLAPAILLWVCPRWTCLHSLIVLFFGWSAYSATWSPLGADAIDGLWKMALGFTLFCIGIEIERVDRFYRFVALCLIPSSMAAMWQAWSGTEVVGLFGNPNMMGEAAAVAIVALTAQGSWISAGAALPALMLAQARSALLATLFFLAGARSLIVVVLVCAAALLLLPEHRDFLATNSLVERATIWSDTMSRLTFFGHGLGSYATSLHSTLSFRIAEHAHNDYLELAFELGVPGVVLGVTIAAAVFLGAANNERLVLGVLATEALFGFPLHAPATSAIGAVVAGHAARAWGELRLDCVFSAAVFRDGDAVDRLRG